MEAPTLENIARPNQKNDAAARDSFGCRREIELTVIVEPG
jgi:hypothetical protein